MHIVQAKGILSAQNGINVYRGCTHGCIYCDTRSDCYQFLYPFEDVEIKENAPALLAEALARKRRPCMVGSGSMCDPYQPLEESFRLTRRCLEVIEQAGCGATLITKSDRVLQDLPLLQRINEKAKSVVQITLTTWNEDLCRLLEPRVCTTARRVDVLQQCRAAGVPTVVWLSPLLPFINDTAENMDAILDACFEAEVRGILCFGVGLTLRRGNREYFYDRLDALFPGMKQRYIETFGDSYSCESPNGSALMTNFHRRCAAQGVLHSPESVFGYLHAFPQSAGPKQLSLFDE